MSYVHLRLNRTTDASSLHRMVDLHRRHGHAKVLSRPLLPRHLSHSTGSGDGIPSPGTDHSEHASHLLPYHLQLLASERLLGPGSQRPLPGHQRHRVRKLCFLNRTRHHPLHFSYVLYSKPQDGVSPQASRRTHVRNRHLVSPHPPFIKPTTN